MPTHQLSLQLITHRVDNTFVHQRSSDGFINGTELCQAASKKFFNYLREENTGHFLRKLADQLGCKPADLHLDSDGGLGSKETWVHPQVAIHLAQWLSPDFAVKVSTWVYEWLSGKGAPKAPAAMPYHIARHMQNLGKVPPSHFSILQEMTTTLIAPMEINGYSLPEKMVPDISQGKMFCKFARDNLGLDTDALPVYMHEYLDGRVVEAKLYPIEHLPAFRKYIADVWMPQRAQGYFKERDPQALVALDKVIQLTYSAKATPLLPPKRKATYRSPLIR